jgi:hypothetical protein
MKIERQLDKYCRWRHKKIEENNRKINSERKIEEEDRKIDREIKIEEGIER